MKKHRRKTEFIDPEVQGALARRVTLHWGTYTLLAVSLVVGLEWMADPFLPLQSHLLATWQTHGTFLLVLLALAPVFVFDAVRLSNRFSGPIQRLRSAAKDLANGQRPNPIHLRQDDFWRDLADDFNRVIERASTREDSQSETSAS